MYFNEQNKFNYKLNKIIPQNLTTNQLNAWIITQLDNTIKEVNDIMKECLSFEENKKNIKSINQLLISYEDLYEEGKISDIDYYSIIGIASSTNISPREEMFLLHICFLINKINEKQTSQIDIMDLLNDKKEDEEEDIFDIFIEEKQKELQEEEEKIQKTEVSYLESFKKTQKTFLEIYNEKFNYTLKDHQIRTISWLIERKYSGIIGADTGVGKTLIGLALSEFLYEVGAIKKILIISPLSAIQVWKNEIEKHLKDDIDCNKYVLINYEKLLSKNFPNINPGDTLCILDEAHRIKNEFSQITAKLKEFDFKYKIGLSATIVDKLSELNYIANIFGFEQPYCEKNETIDIDLAKKFLCNVGANSVGIKKEKEILIGIDLEDSGYYNTLMNKFRNETNEITVINNLNMYCSYNNIFSVVNKFPNQNKKNELKKILTLHSNDQIIIFTSFIETSEHLVKYLNKLKYNVELINGNISLNKRNEIINNFIDNKIQIIVSTQKVLGVSQNLQNSNVIVFYDNGWSMPQRKQAKGRILRIGQTKQCYIYNLFYKNTIEQEILNRVKNKEKDFISIMNELRI